MEVLLRPEDLGAGFRQPDQWVPHSFSILLASNGSSESGVRGELSSSTSSSCQSGESGCPSFEDRCLINLAKAYLTVPPPPPAPAREIPRIQKDRILRPTPKVVLAQAKKYATVALEHLNKRKKIKYELMDVMPINTISESCDFYVHVNFNARSSKKDSQEQLFFAEIQLCSKRKVSSGYLVTCCEPLGLDYTAGHKGFQLDGSVVRKNMDFTRCFGCSPRTIHPQGDKYIAGHCNIPHIYESPC